MMNSLNASHVTVFRKPGRFAGWPANYGIWSWGNEIVVGFTLGYFQASEHFHARDTSRPFETMQARTLDGGVTWKVTPMPCDVPGRKGLSADEHVAPERRVAPHLDGPDGLGGCPGTVDFSHPDFALLCARSGLGEGARSWFYLSVDRCQSWRGPYGLPDFGLAGVAARTDYLLLGPKDILLFLTGSEAGAGEGRIFCAHSEDGGRSFSFRAWVTPPTEGYAIMPASVRLPGGRILTAVRCSEGRKTTSSPRCWIDLYVSNDTGETWRHLSRPVSNTGRGGNPPTLIQLTDGRLCITYGFRDAAYGIRARLSEDDGESWGEELIIRDDGGNHDIGYPRTVQREDGRLVTIYYYHRENRERSIEASIWEAP